MGWSSGWLEMNGLAGWPDTCELDVSFLMSSGEFAFLGIGGKGIIILRLLGEGRNGGIVFLVRGMIFLMRWDGMWSMAERLGVNCALISWV